MWYMVTENKFGKGVVRTKLISKNVILPPQKALWTGLKLSWKVEHLNANVKKCSPVVGVLVRFFFAVEPFYVNSRPSFRQPANILAVPVSSFLQIAQPISSSNSQQARFCIDANLLHVAPRQKENNWGVHFRRLCQIISLKITQSLKSLSLDWLLHCFCGQACTFPFLD